MPDFGDYGCGPRAKFSSGLSHDDLDIPKSQVADTAGSAVNLARVKELHITANPAWDAANHEFETNATSGNQLFDADISSNFAAGEHTNAGKNEDWDNLGDGYYAFTLDAIPYSLYTIAVSTLPSSGTINLVEEILRQTLVRLDTVGVPDSGGDEADNTVTYTHDDTPAP